MNAEYFTADGRKFAYREFYPMPAPAGVIPTHFLVGSSMVPASAVPPNDRECVTSWAVIREVVRENPSVEEAIPVEVAQATPAPHAESTAAETTPQFQMPVLTPHGGLSAAERRVLRDTEA